MFEYFAQALIYRRWSEEYERKKSRTVLFTSSEAEILISKEDDNTKVFKTNFYKSLHLDRVFGDVIDLSLTFEVNNRLRVQVRSYIKQK